MVHIIEATATGTLSMAALLANAQASSGGRVEIIYSNRPETPIDFSNYFDARVKLTKIQMSSSKDKLRSLLSIRKALTASSPNQIFMHSSFAGFLGRIASIGILPGTSFFYIPHCISFMRQDIGTLKRIAFIAFEWVAAIKKAEYIACSDSERQRIATCIPFRKCHLVENALDFGSIPSFVKIKQASKRRVVITVGQIRPQKGPEQFSAIAQAVKAADPSINFVWVGDGDPMARQQLENAGVHVLGWLPKDEVWRHLGEAQLYLSTAKWEGMPVSVIEASSAGLPVIASNCAGNVDVVEHGKTGWLFQSTDEAVQQVLTALNNPELAVAQAKMAFDIAQQRFSVARYVKEMESLTQL